MSNKLKKENANLKKLLATMRDRLRFVDVIYEIDAALERKEISNSLSEIATSAAAEIDFIRLGKDPGMFEGNIEILTEVLLEKYSNKKSVPALDIVFMNRVFKESKIETSTKISEFIVQIREIVHSLRTIDDETPVDIRDRAMHFCINISRISSADERDEFEQHRHPYRM